MTLDMVRDATQQEVQALRRENVELKQLVADLSLPVRRAGSLVLNSVSTFEDWSSSKPESTDAERPWG